MGVGGAISGRGNGLALRMDISLLMDISRRSPGVAPRACARVYARVLVRRIFTYIHITFTYGSAKQ